jgi:hypothetical protein
MLLERVPGSDGVAVAVERLAGLQAQEPRPPFVGLWSRIEGFQREALTDALEQRDVVRATMMRGTLHIVSAADYAALRPAIQPVLQEAMRALRDRAKGLELERVLPVARELLTERPRTFNELRGLLQEAFPKVNHRALGYAVRMHLPLVMVPTEDRWAFPRDSEFTLAEDWLKTGLLPQEASPDALIRSYLGAFGPATVADFQTWSGLRSTKQVFEGLREELRSFKDERGRELFDLPGASRPDDEDATPPPRLLPDFDSLVLAHADRTRVLADEHRAAVVTKNLRVKATFMLDGLIRGTWEVERKQRRTTLSLRPFEALTKRATRELSQEGERLMRFTEEEGSTLDIQVVEP